MIRVRIAPSPTGPMHVGTARTALFNWLFAKNPPGGGNGVFILRIEDTDKERSEKKYEENIVAGLEWLGLDYSEFYRQSERTEIYQKFIKDLLESGNAFYCYHAKEELEKEKDAQMARKEAPRHKCEQKGKGGGGKGGGSIIRFNNPGGKIKFGDLIRGDIEFNVDLLGDFSISKNESTPLYNLAAAIDDYEMKISHVIRGEDHISNTPKQLLIYKALGLEPPIYAHLPMILGTDKSKLSKRHGAISLLEYRDMGYLPDAMFNFLALLGWNPGGNAEILSRADIISKFRLADVQKSGAVFNIEKLDWLNGEYIRKMPLDALAKLCVPYLPKSDFDFLKKVVALEQPRMKKISEIGESAEFFFTDKLEHNPELLKWKDASNEEIKKNLEKLEKLLDKIPEKDYRKEKLEKIIMPKAEEWGSVNGKIDRGRVLWPLRVALTGRKASPGPFEVAEILGKKKCLARVREAETM
ncbi:MAG: glutamate--tRNA ligase [Candidatus Spechtbacterales bacterium]